MENDNLTALEKQKLQNIELARAGVALLGILSGVMYANKTGGGILRYLGWGVAGSIMFGVPALIVSTPFKNRILTKADTRKNEQKEDK